MERTVEPGLLTSDATGRRSFFRSEPRPTHGGIKKKLLVGLVAFSVVAVVLWIIAMPAIVSNRVTAITGCPIEAAQIRINPFGASVQLDQFYLRNPVGFPVAEFVELALLDLDFDLFSLRGEEIRAPRVIIDLRKITIVTKQDGVTNTGVVRQHVDAAMGPSESPMPKFRIGELVVRMGTIELVDYSQGSAPVRRTIVLNADHRFTDVTDARVIVGPLLADLARANATGLIGAFGGLLPEPFRQAFEGAGGLFQDQGRRAGETVKKLIDSLPVGR